MTRLTTQQRIELQRRFDVLHHKGPKVFGFAWIHANEVAIALARKNGFDPTEDLQVKALCTDMAYSICEAAVRGRPIQREGS